MKRIGPRTDPWDTPELTGSTSDDDSNKKFQLLMEKDLCYFTPELCDIFAILDCFLSHEYNEDQHCRFMNIHNGVVSTY